MSLHGKRTPFVFLFLKMFHFLLTAPAQRAQRCGQDPFCGQSFPAILAPAEQTLINAYQSFTDILNELPVPIAQDQRNAPVQFNGSPVKRVRQFHVFFLQFFNHFVARPLQLIHLPEQDMLD